MNVIFLDIDGCCNSVHTKEFLTIPPYNFTGIDDKFIKRLAHIIKYTDAKIVLTSDWGCTNLASVYFIICASRFINLSSIPVKLYGGMVKNSLV